MTHLKIESYDDRSFRIIDGPYVGREGDKLDIFLFPSYSHPGHLALSIRIEKGDGSFRDLETIYLPKEKVERFAEFLNNVKLV